MDNGGSGSANNEFYFAMRQRADQLFMQSARVLIVLNSGAAVAVIGLLQALHDGSGSALAFKGYAMTASLAFVIGILCSVIMMWTRFEYAYGIANGKDVSCVAGAVERLNPGQKGFFVGGMLSFLVGVIIALAGVSCAI